MGALFSDNENRSGRNAAVYLSFLAERRFLGRYFQPDSHPKRCHASAAGTAGVLVEHDTAQHDVCLCLPRSDDHHFGKDVGISLHPAPFLCCAGAVCRLGFVGAATIWSAFVIKAK